MDRALEGLPYAHTADGAGLEKAAPAGSPTGSSVRGGLREASAS